SAHRRLRRGRRGFGNRWRRLGRVGVLCRGGVVFEKERDDEYELATQSRTRGLVRIHLTMTEFAARSVGQPHARAIAFAPSLDLPLDEGVGWRRCHEDASAEPLLYGARQRLDEGTVLGPLKAPPVEGYGRMTALFPPRPRRDEGCRGERKAEN